jgi:hypothetical protein
MRPFPCFIAAGAALAAIGVLSTSGCKKSNPAGDDGGAAAGDLPGVSPLSLLGNFEGEIDLFAKDNKPGAAPTPVAVFVKTGKLRFDVPEKVLAGNGGANFLGPKAYVIFDSSAKKLDIVSDAQKQVIVIDLNKSGEQLKGIGGGGVPSPHGGGAAPSGKPTKITKTGKFDTVAGYKCENWDIAGDQREGTVCVAQEGVSWFSIPMTGIPTEHLWMAELLDGKHFPLRFVGYQKDGTTEESRVEVTKVDKKTLPASQFEYPPSYKVVDLGQMMAGFGALRGGIPGGLPVPPPHAHNPH